MTKHTKTILDPLRQGIEIQGVVADDFGNFVPGPHELWGTVNSIPVTIATVHSGEAAFGMDDLPDVKISKKEAIANLNRLAHCWNCHDDLIAALEKIASGFDQGQGLSGTDCAEIAAEALAKVKS